ncbi:Esterase/lipase [Desulfosarcina cetonica]|uniref:alpha/beta hydrolase n=1 Tax=Desulfosarcina cetonica TaxID=90730 RepID=UPI0006D0D5DF|nr:alpha/beta fold hydrolase [Desulfosarcina cetonica]VTR66262.1 Esterase/lipase [Desulfosarcina cetonica]
MIPKLFLFRVKNKITGSLFPNRLAQKTATLFLTPRRFPIKDWEREAEARCERIFFGPGLSAARWWGQSDKKILIMHGWESRATQMYRLVDGLVEHGFDVIAIDAPGHGHSPGNRANPVVFSQAILEADKKWGPFYGAIGHSMGAAALAIALASGARLGRLVLISSPNNLYDVLMSFARFVGLPKKVAGLFVSQVENEVGLPARNLDVGTIFSQKNPQALIIHAKNDREVSYKNHEAIMAACPGLQSHSPESLGHRRIIQSPQIAQLIRCFYGVISQ